MSESTHPIVHIRSLMGGKNCPQCGMTATQFEELRKRELLDKHKIVHGHCVCGCPHSCQETKGRS